MGVGHGGSDPRTATVSVSAVEELIASLPGVASVRIMLEESGALGEVHVLADATRHPKAIVRDIESGLAARWGMVVDHRRISIAQMGDAPLRPHWSRLRLQQWAVNIDPIRGWTEVTVSLTPEAGTDPFGRPRASAQPAAIWQGRAAGGSGGHTGMRLAAEATLQALNQSLLPNHGLALGDLDRMSLGQYEIVVCLVHYRAPRGSGDILTGSALVRNEAIEAAVRSVLNASNRIYGVASRPPASGEVPAGGPGAIDLARGSAEAAAAADPDTGADSTE